MKLVITSPLYNLARDYEDKASFEDYLHHSLSGYRTSELEARVSLGSMGGKINSTASRHGATERKTQFHGSPE